MDIFLVKVFAKLLELDELLLQKFKNKGNSN
jgi:hypothetical protein